LDAANQLTGTVTIITAPQTQITAVHIHDGDIGVNTQDIVATLTQTSPGVWTVPATPLTDARVARFRAAGFYVNVHTSANADGEIRGQLMSFTDDIQTIFDDHCVACHRAGGPVGRAAFTGLFLTPGDSYSRLVNQPAVQSTGLRVLPFDADNSVLFQRTAGVGFAAVVGERMPLESPVLEQRDIDLIRIWIIMGAMDDNGVAPAPQTPPARDFTRQAFLNAAQITAGNIVSDVTGSATFALNTGTGIVTGTMTITVPPASAPTTTITNAHIHDGFVGVDGGVVVPLSTTDGGINWTVSATATPLTPEQMNKFIAGGFYVNLHTQANPDGEIRGQLMSFADNIQTIFNGRCVFCHDVGGPAAFTGLLLGPGASYGNLVPNQQATQQLLTEPSAFRVVPFESANSVLYNRVTGTVTNTGNYSGARHMPASATPLSTNDQNLIKIWIDMGAANN
jgi:hypothetical protein